MYPNCNSWIFGLFFSFFATWSYAQPVALCQNINAYLAPTGIVQVAAIALDGGSTGATQYFINGAATHTFTCSNLGANSVPFSVQDGLGNADTCLATVMVFDTILPVVVCNSLSISLNAAGVASITVGMLNLGATDNCAVASFQINGQLGNQQYTCAHLGANTALVSATDASGNVGFCTSTITIMDNTPPVVICQSITDILDINGLVTITAAQVNNSSTDNCGLASLLINGQSSQQYSCANVGMNNITLAAMDLAGNMSTCMAIVTVIDTNTNVPSVPLAVCISDTLDVFLGANNTASISPQQIYAGLPLSCGLLSVAPSSFSIADVGFNTVVLTVLGAGGSSDVCTAIVNVIDTLFLVEITGTVYLTSDTCATGSPLPLALVALQPAGLYVFTDTLGNYQFFVPSIDTYTISLPYPPNNAVVTCPNSGVITVAATALGYYGTNNFYVSMPAPTHNVAVWTVSSGLYRPGFLHDEYVYFNNIGTFVESGVITYTLDNQSILNNYTIHSNQITWLSTLGNTLSFAYNNLQLSGGGYIEFTVFTPLATPLGDSIINCASISVSGNNDSDMSNNQDCNESIVRASYDPNIKEVSPHHSGNAEDGGDIYANEEVLDYTIHFQNTGTAAAINVVLRDTLSSYLLPHSIENIHTSHPCQLHLEAGNILVAEFENIYLPDSSSDYLGSMGFLHFAIHRQMPLAIGTSIHNTAAIYFDLNAPVITNTCTSTLAEPLGQINTAPSNALYSWVAPNPFANEIRLSYQLSQPSLVSFQWLNVLGEVLEMPVQTELQAAGDYQQTFPTAHLPAGIYFLRLANEQNQVVHRIIKE